MEATFEQGYGSGPLRITATWTGTPPANLYIGAVVEGQGIDPAITVLLSPDHADITLVARDGLAPGHYAGRVLALVCADSACTQRLGGSPLPIDYSITVNAAVRVVPSAMLIGSVSSNRQPITQVLDVQVRPGAGFQSRVISNSPWLQLGVPTQTTQPVTFHPWRAGTYTATVEFSAGIWTTLATLTYEVAAPPGGEQDLALAPASLAFSAVQDTTAAPRSLALTLPSWSDAPPSVVIEYASGFSSWLRVDRSDEGFQVTARAWPFMGPGTYSATLVFTPMAPALPVEVPVTLVVTGG